jgi:hypothetical protein
MNYIKFLIYFLFSKIILLSIYVSRLKKINLLHTSHFGFGDYLFFCVEIREKLDSKTKIFCFSKLQNEIASFFFDKKYIVNSYFLMPKFMSESRIGYQLLSKNINFKPTNLKRITPDNSKIPISDWYEGTKDSIEFIKQKIDNSRISKALVEVFKKPTLCFFIKNFSKNKNNHLNFQVRQTRNLDKINELLKFLDKQKINILVLGTQKDHFIQILENDMKTKNYNNIYLFKNLSEEFSIADQAFSAYNSIGYVGSSTGTMGFFGLLDKKVVVVDAVSYYADKYWSNFTFLYKKILNKKNEALGVFIWKKYYDPKENKIIENSYEDIKIAIEKKLINRIDVA